ncbi:hypothetical protein E5332_11280 [Enterorhabdus sp. NM05_H27]|uniref:Uncharacterized protein n=1 Tax=Adlercreutzia muris TaxID=1796610 RepID=A0A7C8BQJ1_9ACTN|nr:hypothetical protein F8D48_07910 [Adlercreutzia muris]NCA33012.1 hypothetical protein [Adlercreutzia muris]TGY66185.1 hypothetical protein E5332_11280 [Enterorhabdus sp. NM05_H27]
MPHHRPRRRFPLPIPRHPHPRPPRCRNLPQAGSRCAPRSWCPRRRCAGTRPRSWRRCPRATGRPKCRRW